MPRVLYASTARKCGGDFGYVKTQCDEAITRLEFQMDALDPALDEDGECIQRANKEDPSGCRQGCKQALEGMKACDTKEKFGSQPAIFKRTEEFDDDDFQPWRQFHAAFSQYDANFLEKLKANNMHGPCVDYGISLLPPGSEQSPAPDFFPVPRAAAPPKRKKKKRG